MTDPMPSAPISSCPSAVLPPARCSVTAGGCLRDVCGLAAHGDRVGADGVEEHAMDGWPERDDEPATERRCRWHVRPLEDGAVGSPDLGTSGGRREPTLRDHVRQPELSEGGHRVRGEPEAEPQFAW
jgi:hypothetical protein